MRKFFKTSMLLVLAVIMLISSTMTCMAATPRTTIIHHSSGINFVGNGSDKVEFSTTYKTIAYVDTSRSTGLGAEIVILVPTNTSISDNDIIMLDRNGNRVWEEFGAIPYEGIRSFECGSDVYTVQIRTQNGSGQAYAGFVRSL